MRSELSTRRLVTAFAALIIERGYERTTLADIGKRAGYSRGLVSTRFGSKANLLMALVEEMSARYGEQRHLLIGNRVGVDALQRLIHEIARDARESPESLRAFYALLFECLNSLDNARTPIRNAERTFREELTALVATGVTKGQVRPGTDPALLAGSVHDMLRGACYHWLLDSSFDFPSWMDSLAAHLSDVYRVTPSP
jgi:AcrR family transcriptional regulator